MIFVFVYFKVGPNLKYNVFKYCFLTIVYKKVTFLKMVTYFLFFIFFLSVMQSVFMYFNDTNLNF